MDPVAILNLIAKGVQVAETLIQVGENALPALKVIWGLATGGAKDTVTQEEMDEAEATLDALLAEFNAPLPPDDE